MLRCYFQRSMWWLMVVGKWIVRRWYWVVAALLVALVFSPGGTAHAGPVQQADDPLSFDVSVGFDGFVEPGMWTPITVVASNEGEDVSGELRVEAASLTGRRTLYTYALELPRGSRKRVTFYASDLSGFDREVEVDFVRRGAVIASQQVKVEFVDQNTLFVGLWSDSPQALADFGLLEPTDGETVLATLTVDDLPASAEGWQALDVLVIHDVDTGQLSAEQLEALEEWITQGGRLIVTGGLGYQRTLGGLGALPPVSVDGTESVSLAPLGALINQPFPVQAQVEALVAAGTLAEGGQVLAAADGMPLLAKREVGYGRVDFLAADPGLEPLRSWEGLEGLWAWVLTDGDPRPGWAYGFQGRWDAASQAISAVPGVQLPSVIQLCGFLGVYVVLVGPVNYLVLKRLKRRELSWLTIPILVILFSAMAYVTGFQLRGSQAILHQLTVVQTWPDSDRARVESLLGVWSPRRAPYDIQLEPGYLVRPMPSDFGGGTFSAINDITVEQGEETTLRHVRVDVGAVQPFVIEGFEQDAPRISGDLRLGATDEGIHVAGEIVNEGEFDLADVSLVLAGAVRALPDLPAGEVLPVDVVVKNTYATRAPAQGLDLLAGNPANYGGYPYTYDLIPQLAHVDNCYTPSPELRRCNLLTALLASDSLGSGAYLMGWSDYDPATVQVLNANTRSIDLSLHIAELSTRLERSAEQPDSIPPGLMTWRFLEVSPTGYVAAPYEFYLESGQAVSFRYEPLRFVPLPEVEALIIHLESSYGDQEHVPLVDLWDYSAGRWKYVAPGWGDTVIDAVDRFVDPMGGVQVRVRVPSAAPPASISRLDVTLLGQASAQDGVEE
jgi:hypothetical protein